MSYSPPYSPKEELANVITHGFGFLVAIAALTYMLSIMPQEFSAGQKAGVIVYGISLILMFLSSTLYHAAKSPGAKQFLKRFDHCAIYLLIAGTYTPILTIGIQSTLANMVLMFIWMIAVLGVIFKAFFAGQFERFSVGAYLVMGWSGIVIIYQVYQELETPAFVLLLAGGVLYSVGVIFYVNKRIPFNHAVWHGFVFAGALTHCWLIVRYMLIGS